MSNKISSLPLLLSKKANIKISTIIKSSSIPNLKLRIYIIGGGCSGFQYQFKFDEKQHKNDTIICQSDSKIIVDHISLQYLIGGTIDYTEDLEGSKFIIFNPAARSTCGCGSSFSI